jgi:hypothetical protein
MTVQVNMDLMSQYGCCNNSVHVVTGTVSMHVPGRDVNKIVIGMKIAFYKMLKFEL